MSDFHQYDASVPQHDLLDDMDDMSKRRRISRACEQCRRKKIRCDGEKHCSNCHAYKTVCIYTEPVKKARAAPRGAKYIAGLEDRVKKLESLFSKTGQHERVHSHASCVDVSALDHVSAESHEESFSIHSDGIDDDLAERTGVLLLQDDGESQYVGPANPATALISASKQVGRITGDESFDMFCDRSREKYTASQKSQDGDFMLARERYAISRLQKPRLPDRATCDLYIGYYFDRLQYVFPLLDQKEFLGRTAEMHNPGVPSDPAFHCIYLLVLSLGAHVGLDVALEQEDGICHQLYTQAHKLMFSFLGTTSLQTVQALMLLALYLESTGRNDTLWMLLGNIIRMCQTLGLHRKMYANHAADSEAHQARLETRRRTFWLAYVMDKKLVISSGKCAGIQDFDCDQDMPAITAEEFERSGGLCFADGTTFSFLIASIQMAKLSHNVQQQLYSIEAQTLKPDQLANRIDELDAKCLTWVSTLPAIFRPDTAKASSSADLGQNAGRAVYMYQSTLAPLMHMRYQHLMMTIHRRHLRSSNVKTTGSPPVAHASEHAPRSDVSYIKAIHAARSCLDVLSTKIELRQDACIRMNLTYPAGAVLFLFSHVVHAPGSSSARTDLDKLRLLANYLKSRYNKDQGLAIARDFFIELVSFAEMAIDKASTQGIKRNWKDAASYDDTKWSNTAMPQPINTVDPIYLPNNHNVYGSVIPGSETSWTTPINSYDPESFPPEMHYTHNLPIDYYSGRVKPESFYGSSNAVPQYTDQNVNTMSDPYLDDLLWRLGVPPGES